MGGKNQLLFKEVFYQLRGEEKGVKIHLELVGLKAELTGALKVKLSRIILRVNYLITLTHHQLITKR